MSNEYSLGYPVNTDPSGDTVKEAVEKHISEFLKAYADLTALYQQILTEMKYANVDMVDGKHADGTANNIPLLDSNGVLKNNVNNVSVTTETLNVTKTAKIASLEVNGKDLSTVLSSSIKIETGIVANGQAIPLPSGFTQEQCKWFVMPRTLSSTTVREIDSFVCSADENRVVTLTVEGQIRDSHKATYVIIGIKT